MKAQLDAEFKFKNAFLESQSGTEKEWHAIRNDILGYNKYDLQDQLMSTGRMPGKKSSRELLLLLNKYELIRIGVIDLLKSMNKSDLFAAKMGNLAKYFAEKQELAINYDLEANVLPFKPNTQEVHPEILAMDYFENQAYSA